MHFANCYTVDTSRLALQCNLKPHGLLLSSTFVVTTKPSTHNLLVALSVGVADIARLFRMQLRASQLMLAFF